MTFGLGAAYVGLQTGDTGGGKLRRGYKSASGRTLYCELVRRTCIRGLNYTMS